MADYCVRVRFKYSESDLGIVETNNALYTYDMMVKDMMTLSDKYPDIISYFELTKSLDGKPIYVMVFGNPNAKNHVMVQSTIHGREYMNTQLVMRMIEYYAVYYNTGTYDGVAYSDLFDNTNLYIVPMANPDGVSISQFGLDGVSSSDYKELIEECYERDKYYMVYKEDSEGDMYWDDRYKDESFDRSSQENTREITFDEYTREWKSNAQGVDLNRNFNAGWIDIDEKDYPSYGSFKGYQPVSEPETQGLVDLANQYDFSYYLSYHSKGNLIYYGCSENSQDTAIKVENLATLMENFIKFKKVDSSKSYNTTLGGFNDFVQLGLNKSGVTIESGKHRCPLDISEFTPMWLRHRESWAMLAKTLY
jgi:g-D-glutamyl-meso-diaminopimelate peptidase